MTTPTASVHSSTTESLRAASTESLGNASSPSSVRLACRSGQHRGPTAGFAAGFAQANLVILPADWADEFAEFCARNPKPCPVLERLPTGSYSPLTMAANADIRSDLPSYRIWKNGMLTGENTDILDLWQPDFVCFLIGCSFTFEAALLDADLPVRHVEQGCNVPMFATNIDCEPAGRFSGKLVVSMRPFTPRDAVTAVQITSKYPHVHGAPVHIARPDLLGIRDLSRPDFGDAVRIADDEIPVFWACGVTPQLALQQARPPIAITHSPGCMFVCDVRDSDLLEQK